MIDDELKNWFTHPQTKKDKILNFIKSSYCPFKDLMFSFILFVLVFPYLAILNIIFQWSLISVGSLFFALFFIGPIVFNIIYLCTKGIEDIFKSFD